MSNCTGTRGKKALDPAKLELIRQEVIKFWPPDSATASETWKECIKAIDEGGRSLKQKQKKLALMDVSNIQ